MTLSERVYRVLLKTYPAAYRKAYGEPMALTFRDQVRNAASSSKLALLWMRTLADWPPTAFARHLEKWSGTNAQKSIVVAQHNAAGFFARELTVEDLLFAVLQVDRPLADTLLDEAAVNAIRREIVRLARRKQRKRSALFTVPWSVEFFRVITRATEEAKLAGLPRADTRHFIASILLEEGTVASSLLRHHGVDRARDLGS